MMKIATYNVNGVNGRLPRLVEWLEETGPDVACLQEIKTIDSNCPAKAIADAGYEAIWHGQRSHHGVAILARGKAMREARRVYTFWVNTNAFRRNAGFRMDFLLLTPDLAPKLEAAEVDTDFRGREGASDHAPTWITLR